MAARGTRSHSGRRRAIADPLLEHLAPSYLDHSSVRALGFWRGWCFYLDSRGERQALRWDEHSPRAIALLFAAEPGELRRLWPAHGPDGAVIGWYPNLAADSLQVAAMRAGMLWPAEAGFRLGGMLPVPRRRGRPPV